MADSMERDGKKIIAKSIVYYSIQRAKSGRRSYSGIIGGLINGKGISDHNKWMGDGCVVTDKTDTEKTDEDVPEEDTENVSDLPSGEESEDESLSDKEIHQESEKRDDFDKK